MEINVDNGSIEKIVEGQIKAAVLEALASKSESVIEHLVTAALSEPDKNSYGRKTIVQAEIDKAIVEEANNAAKEWLDAQRPKIRALVKARLEKGTHELVKTIADQLVARFAGGFDVSVWFKEMK